MATAERNYSDHYVRNHFREKHHYGTCSLHLDHHERVSLKAFERSCRTIPNRAHPRTRLRMDPTYSPFHLIAHEEK